MRTNEPKKKLLMPSPDCMDITDEKFQELTDVTVKMVEETELGKNKSMYAMLMVHFREFNEQFMPSDIQGAVTVLAGGMSNAEEKHETIKHVGRMCFEKRWFPVAVFMVAESWQSKNYPKYKQASEDPDRTECIMIAGKTPKNDCKVGIMIPLARDKDGTMIRGGDNMVTKEIETYLLNQFFWGFFEKVAGKMNDDEDIRPGPGPSGRG